MTISLLLIVWTFWISKPMSHKLGPITMYIFLHYFFFLANKMSKPNRPGPVDINDLQVLLDKEIEKKESFDINLSSSSSSLSITSNIIRMIDCKVHLSSEVSL